jgi:hypothetical protein
MNLQNEDPDKIQIDGLNKKSSLFIAKWTICRASDVFSEPASNHLISHCVVLDSKEPSASECSITTYRVRVNTEPALTRLSAEILHGTQKEQQKTFMKM